MRTSGKSPRTGLVLIAVSAFLMQGCAAAAVATVTMVWPRTEDLLERWAHVLSERLGQLSDLGAPGRRTPSWAR